MQVKDNLLKSLLCPPLVIFLSTPFNHYNSCDERFSKIQFSRFVRISISNILNISAVEFLIESSFAPAGMSLVCIWVNMDCTVQLD